MDTKLRCFWNWKTELERREFSRESKLEAVKLVRDRGFKVAQAARDLDLHAAILHSWVREFAGDPREAFPWNGQTKPEQL
jgi:transposase